VIRTSGSTWTEVAAENSLRAISGFAVRGRLRPAARPGMSAAVSAKEGESVRSSGTERREGCLTVLMRTAASIGVSVVLLALVNPLSAQEPAFETASIRPNLSGGLSNINPMPNGRLIVTNASVRSLILRAFGLHDSQLIGAPAWIDTERFDVDARAEPARGGPQALIPMLRTLLIDRFALRAHTEARELPAYVLVLARNDRPLGSGIRSTQADCSTAPVMTGPEVIASGKNGWPPCGMSSTAPVTTVSDGGVTISATIRRSAIEMKDFATSLQGDVGRPVVDRTGLAGRFDVQYSYVLRRPPNQTTQLAPTSVAPTIFVALEEQLGLKLDSQRAEIPVLVVDAVERPSEN
jgi:uncharacterized protein (TIGR03435 family)